MSEMNLSDVIVGDRTRKDMGDIEALAKSMQEHGLLHPIVVLNDGTLVAGGRRLAAAGLLGWQQVPVTTVNVADLLSAERDENSIRKDLTPTEAVAIARLIEARERPKAQERIKEGSARAHGSQPGPSIARPPVREIAAAAVGMAGRTYQRAKEVVQAAEAEPELYGDLAERMDDTGQVYPAHEELKRRREGKAATRSDVHYRAQYPKPNREMERGLIALDGLVTGFGLIELDGLDRAKKSEWAEALDRAASSLKKIARQVRQLNG